MSSTRYLLLIMTGLCVSSAATAQTILIDPTTNNGSFEYADGVLSTAKIGFDVTPDVDNWTQWTEVSPAAKNSGVENLSTHATDGGMIAYLEYGDAIYNLTSYVASEGDFFGFSWDHVQRESRAHRVGLVYDDGGTITSIVDSELFSTDPSPGIPTTYTNYYTIPAGSPAIGHAVGLGIFASDSEGGGYPEVDNFILTVGGQEPVVGDVNGDYVVDLNDFNIIRDNFRLSPATKEQGDITGTDIVDLDDFLLWRSNYPYPVPSGLLASLTQSVPEPSSWLLITLGLAAIGSRRRWRR